MSSGGGKGFSPDRSFAGFTEEGNLRPGCGFGVIRCTGEELAGWASGTAATEATTGATEATGATETVVVAGVPLSEPEEDSAAMGAGT